MRRARRRFGIAGFGSAILAYALLCITAANAPLRAMPAAHKSLMPAHVSSQSTSPSAPGELVVHVDSRAGVAFTSEDRAEELYVDALEKVAAGHIEWARVTLRELVDRYPDAKVAALARLRLVEIDNGQRAVTKVPSASTTQSAAAALVRSPAWDRELRRNALVQARLRKDAGDRVFFGPGSSELGARARAALSAQASWLRHWREFEAAIEGNADDPGTESENLRLSEQRAEAVRKRLVEEGVDPARIAVVAMGRNDRLATCRDSACGAQNRRVVTLVFVPGTRKRLGLDPVESAEASGPVQSHSDVTSPIRRNALPAKPVGLTH
jgi:outer membrane protein OmpA-like peptidoglycan-associated protein